MGENNKKIPRMLLTLNVVILAISVLNPFACVAAQYPFPLASPQPVTRLDAGFSSEGGG